MMGSHSFDDVSSFILTTSSNSFPHTFGTATTPTLTPTTLKSISDCLAGQGDELYRQLEHEHQAGFVPPDVDFTSSVFRNSQPQQQLLPQSLQSQGQENVSNNFLHSASDDDSAQVTDEDLDDESTSFSTGAYSQCHGDSASNDSQETYSTKSSTRRNNNANHINNNIVTNNNNNNNKSSSRAKTRTTVRKTRGARNDEKLPPEEENRRRMRRERNKQAAARCRKRRLDHTTELTQITDGLEEEKRKLQQQLAELQRQQEQLELCMKSHMSECRKNHRPQVKTEHQQPSSQSPVQLSSMAKNRRPSSLPLGPSFAVSSSTSSSSNNSSPAVTSNSSSLPGANDSLIPIQTPSNGLFVDFGGLTPLLSTPSAGGFMPSVSCGGQIRSQFPVPSESMVTSPDGGPTPGKLVSL